MKNEPTRPIYIKHKLANVLHISKIVTMHYFEFDKNFHFAGEVHDFWEMVYVDSGNVLITAAKKNYVLKQGEVLFHKPNEFHTISSDQKAPSNVFIISFVSTSKSMAFFRNKKTVLPESLRPFIQTLIQEGERTFDLPFNTPSLRKLSLRESAPFGGQQIIRQTLEQLLILLIRTGTEQDRDPGVFPSKESMEHHLVSSIIRLLDENVYGRITVSDICNCLHYSRTYISRIFNQSCGCTIIEYYTRLKIKEAKKRIRENRYTFTEISEMLRFDNPHYFSRVFKKTTNMTPRDYQHSVKK
ncbi:MAG: AraC family transcriptional regulator [Clostridia bacterium]|nr:AraC family transcriptional regulator [Oscillospiraceae bacterium]MBQ7033249.1 AraC family transcriptional regulator [Clostridia bacterium]